MEETAFAVVRYITEHYADITTLAAVAQHFALSPSTASRYIKEATGVSFSEYVGKLRLEYAAHELASGERSINEIAAAHGFSSVSVFSRTFRSVYGMPPREYRKCHAADPASHITRSIRLNADAEARVPRCTLGVSMGSIATAGLPGFVPHVMEVIDAFHLTDIRVHNLFSDFVYRRNRQYERTDYSHDGYEFSFVDGLFDALASRGVTIGVELSDRGWSIRQTFSRDLVTVGHRPVFDSPQQVRHAALTLARHWKERYTADRLDGWSFDLWYDPAIGNLDTYVQLLRDLRAELHDLIPGCAVGGCAISMDENRLLFDDFAAALERHHVSPDFVSIHSYAHSLDEDAEDGGTLCRQISRARATLNGHGIDCPLRVCSWDPVPSQRNRYNDSCEKASMMLQELTACLDLPVSVTYGSLTDFSSLYSDVLTAPFFGGTGLVSKDGFPKPAMHAFTMFNQLPRHILGQGRGFVFGRDDSRSFTLLLWNRTGLSPQFDHTEEYKLTMQQIKLLYQPERDATYMVELHNMPRNRYLLREYLVDDGTGHGVAACSRRGVDGLTPVEDHPYLIADSLPDFSVCKVAVADGTLRFRVGLNPHGFAMIKLTEY